VITVATSNVFSYDPLEFGTILGDLLKQDNITNINCWYGKIFVSDNVKGEYEYSLDQYSQDEIKELKDVIQKLPNRLANRMVVSYNEGAPILDAETEYENIGRLRVNVIHNFVNGSDYPAISIRRTLMKVRMTKAMIVDSGYASKEMVQLIKALVEAGSNIMISGVTGSGKTELLRYIARFIRDNEAIITIEDTREAYLEYNYKSKHILALKTSDEQGFPELIRACLRQNPDWICVSETRSTEVLDLLNAVETGHRLISTIHADSATSIPNRMVSMAKTHDGTEANRIYRQIYENIDIGIYIYFYENQEGAHRLIAEIAEFYIDDDGNTKSHIICEYDFIENCFKYNKIESKKIKKNLIKKHVDTNYIKGEFLDG